MTVIEKKVNVYNGLRTHVLEDDQDMNDLLREMFDLIGLLNVTFFDDSELFVGALDENIHLCILDHIIKGSNLQGMDVARIIRARFPKCKLIFVSGTDDPKILKQIIKIKPDGYVDKQEPDYLRKVVEESLPLLSGIKNNLEYAERLERRTVERES